MRMASASSTVLSQFVSPHFLALIPPVVVDVTVVVVVVVVVVVTLPPEIVVLTGSAAVLFPTMDLNAGLAMKSPSKIRGFIKNISHLIATFLMEKTC